MALLGIQIRSESTHTRWVYTGYQSYFTFPFLKIFHSFQINKKVCGIGCTSQQHHSNPVSQGAL